MPNTTRSEPGEGLRYLCYEAAPDRAGINHHLRNLQWLMREAFALGRLALLPPLDLDAWHNFGVERPWCWDTYFDLGASRLVDADGKTQHPLPIVRELPPGLRAVGVHATSRADGPLRRHELLIRHMSDNVYANDLGGGRLPAYGFRMRPSRRVLSLAKPVLAALRARAPVGFAAVHVRRGDRLGLSCVERATRPEAVCRRLARLGVARGATVFVLSDERAPAWWTALESRYAVVRSAAFPALARLAAPDGEPDNYLLYEVEKEVMRNADTRVETLPGDYEPADATLVSPVRWMLARPLMLRHAARRRLRRAVGERAWAALRRVRGALPRPPGGRAPSKGAARRIRERMLQGEFGADVAGRMARAATPSADGEDLR